MPISCAALMCHAPIVIPEIAGMRAHLCRLTTEAMAQTAACILSHAPEVVVIISPHSPRDPSKFGIVAEVELSGDFGAFGAPEVELRLPGAPGAAQVLREIARERGLATRNLSGAQLDHGALVPLHFLRQAGWLGPTLLLGLPYPNTHTEADMGRAIAAAALHMNQRWCVLASGDMSHRLTQGAPAGYHPRACEFDARFRSLIERGELEHACEVASELRGIAAEDVVDSCTVAAASVAFDAAGHRVFGYEGPFGVGYLEAVLHQARDGNSTLDAGEPPADEMLAIARQAIARHLRGERYEPPSLPPAWDLPRGVFVTLRRQGELRGCIGHIEPLYAALATEIASCAVASASRDPRFGPLQPYELADLEIEISLLSPCEAVAHVDELDPDRYGIVVSAGNRRGVLLPRVAGVHSNHDQLRIAMSKAGLTGSEDVCIERFQVLKLQEHTTPARHELH